MQISVESTGPLEKTLRVEVPEDRIASEVQNRLQSLSRSTRVQGFRPGKAPMKVIQQRFGERVRQEVIGEVVQSSFFEALTRENLRPAGSPRIEPVNASRGEGLRYTAKFEVLPDFELVAIEKLELEQPVCEIQEADVDRMVETLRRQRRTLQAVERASRPGDVVEMDFTGVLAGEAFDGGTGKDFRVELGEGRLIRGFEEGLAGRKAGEEFDLDLQYPDNHGNDKLRGKPVRFHVRIGRVLESVLPAVDDALFRDFGVKDGGEPAFRIEVREHMEREAKTAIRNRLRESVMDVLYKANEITLPKGLVEREKDRLRRQFNANLKAYGIEAAADDERLNDPGLFQEQARKRVALQLIVGEIIRKQELRADPAKVRRIIENNAQSYEDPAAIVSWYYANRARLAEVEAVALEDEVMEWIGAQARVKRVPVTFDELMNKRQTEAG